MSVLDTLEICFSANLNGVDAQLNALAGQLGGLSSAALAAQGAFSGAGAQLAAALGGGFAGAVPAIQAQVSGAGMQLAASLGAAAAPARAQGAAMATAFSAGIQSGASAAASAANSVSTGARFDGGMASARSSGRALASGFAAGIRDGSSAVNSAVNAIVNSATRRIRSLLSIHSPSRVARGLGAYFGEGFAEGIAGSVDGVERASGIGRAWDCAGRRDRGRSRRGGFAGAGRRTADGSDPCGRHEARRGEHPRDQRGDAQRGPPAAGHLSNRPGTGREVRTWRY